MFASLRGMKYSKTSNKLALAIYILGDTSITVQLSNTLCTSFFGFIIQNAPKRSKHIKGKASHTSQVGHQTGAFLIWLPWCEVIHRLFRSYRHFYLFSIHFSKWTFIILISDYLKKQKRYYYLEKQKCEPKMYHMLNYVLYKNSSIPSMDGMLLHRRFNPSSRLRAILGRAIFRMGAGREDQKHNVCPFRLWKCLRTQCKGKARTWPSWSEVQGCNCSALPLLPPSSQKRQ